MIIKYNNQVGFKNRLEELVTLAGNFNTGLTEEDLYRFLLDEQSTHRTNLEIEPDIYDFTKARANVGWKATTLRYFAYSDEFSMFLPEPEMLPTKSNVKDIQKESPNADKVMMSKAELLRYLKNIEVEVAKLKEEITNGTR